MTQIDNDEAQARADRNRAITDMPHVYNIAEQYENIDDSFVEVAMKGATRAAVADRTPGRGAIRGKTLVDRAKYESCHLIQTAFIEPGDRKYLHRHTRAETIWVIIEGSGEFYSGPNDTDVHPFKAGDLLHALPGQWHGMGNTGSIRVKYLSIEGPQPFGDGFDDTIVME